MFRDMRRSAQALTEAECIAILNRGSAGVLALTGDDGYPYAVPLSYAYENGRIYFHSAQSGHKLDAIRRLDKASFCIIDQDNVVSNEFTTYYRSVIAFGRVRELTDESDKRHALTAIAVKYSPDQPPQPVIERNLAHVCMLVFAIEHLSGKQAKELTQASKTL